MNGLEQRLTELRDHVAFPPTPELSFVLDLATSPVARPRRRLVLALALVAAAVAVGALALSPGARSAFLELLRLRGATIERTGGAPVVDELTSRPLGVPVELEEARARSRLPLLVPRGYSAVTFDARLPAVTFVWAGRRLFLTELRGEALPLIQKSTGPGTTVRYTEVGGRPGYWLEGDRHLLVLRAADGRFVESRAAGNVLLWEAGGLVLRLEGARTRAEALAIAEPLGR